MEYKHEVAQKQNQWLHDEVTRLQQEKIDRERVELEVQRSVREELQQRIEGLREQFRRAEDGEDEEEDEEESDDDGENTGSPESVAAAGTAPILVSVCLIVGL